MNALSLSFKNSANAYSISGLSAAVSWTLAEIAAILFIVCGVLTVAAFGYSIARVIFNSDDEEKRKEAKYILTWSLVALFVLTTIWGIIGFIQWTVGNTNGPGQIDIEVPLLP